MVDSAAMKAAMSGRQADTADRILDVAEGLVQVRGFNAFSYADVAKVVKIRKASLHHHFATKADLGLALVTRYRRAFLQSLGAIEANSEDAMERLEAYAGLYGSVLRRGRMCMCGILAADAATLPRPMRESIAGFFAENKAWLTRVLEQGKKQETLQFEGSAASTAAFIISSLEGAMLVSRGSANLEDFDAVARRLLDGVRPSSVRRDARVTRRRRPGGHGGT